MNRDITSFTPTAYTRICSEHFRDEDFNEADLRHYKSYTHPEGQKFFLRLKKNAIPNRDSLTIPASSETTFSNELDGIFQIPLPHNALYANLQFFVSQLDTQSIISLSNYLLTSQNNVLHEAHPNFNHRKKIRKVSRSTQTVTTAVLSNSAMLKQELTPLLDEIILLVIKAVIQQLLLQ